VRFGPLETSAEIAKRTFITIHLASFTDINLTFCSKTQFKGREFQIFTYLECRICEHIYRAQFNSITYSTVPKSFDDMNNCFREFYSDFIFITGLGIKKEKALIYSPTVLSNPFLLIKRYAFAKKSNLGNSSRD
jgi:hypothetical protein